MLSEWMKVMIDEIARKKAEADGARQELQRRAEEQRTSSTAAGPDASPSVHGSARHELNRG